MSAVQIIVVAFGIAMAFATYRAYRRRDLIAPEALMWSVVWLCLIVVTVFPNALRTVVGPLEVARLLDLVMIGAILVLTLLVFALNTRLRRNERRVVELVRRLAISAYETGGHGKETVSQVHDGTRESGK